MNQILVIKIKKNYKNFFKIQLIISLIIIVIIVIYYFLENQKNKEMEKISKILNANIELSKIYETEKQNVDLYLGKIIVEKIDLEYIIFNQFTEELLKIAPCKFYGTNIGKQGNICIAGHNYNDNRFFSRVSELKLNDKIKLIDMNDKEYEYVVYDIFETEETDVESVIKKRKAYELTLLTCNNSNNKRIIVKAFLNQ